MLRLRPTAFILGLALLGAITTPAQAETPGVPSWISEAKVGLLTHDSYMFEDNFLQVWKNRIEPGMDINGEVLFNLPGWFRHVGSPRLAVGADISTANKTSYAYIAPDWQYTFQNGLYLGGFFGFMVHTGAENVSQRDGSGNITPASQERFDNTKRLGSRVLFHFGPRVGYSIDEHNDIELMWAHSSNGHILANDDAPNQGIDNLGIRYGYKF